MKRNLFVVLLLTTLVSVYTGCSNDDDNSTPGVPYEPTQGQLADGPEPGKSFLHWNATGVQRAAVVDNEVSGWCYHGVATEISIPDMLGLSVQAASLAGDSLQCTIQVTDTGYTQTEYAPEGTEWADSVSYWVNDAVVELPQGVQPQDVTFYWYRRDDGTFFEVPTQYTNGQWIAKTVHFSRYILGQKRSAN